jgi:hypothetical protein
VALILAALAAAWIGYGIWLLLRHEREVGARTTCYQNLQRLGQAMLLYLEDNAQVIPPGPAWCGALLPYVYVSQARVLVCPRARDSQCSYALSAASAGIRADRIAEPECIVVLFESDHGWNSAGGAELLPEEPRHMHGDLYAFVDGHAAWWLRKYTEDSQGRRLWTQQPYDRGRVRWQPVLKETSSPP